MGSVKSVLGFSKIKSIYLSQRRMHSSVTLTGNVTLIHERHKWGRTIKLQCLRLISFLLHFLPLLFSVCFNYQGQEGGNYNFIHEFSVIELPASLAAFKSVRERKISCAIFDFT